MTLLQRRDRQLTPAEKIAARRFRDAAQAELTRVMALDPPTFVVPAIIAIFRHNCAARPHRESTALQLKECYVPSTDILEPGWLGHEVEAAKFDAGELPLFGFIYRKGRCQGCGVTARSPIGRLVLMEERPPIAGRMARL